MNKEYYVLEVEDTSSAEFTKNYWKKQPKFSLREYIKEYGAYPEQVPDLNLEIRIYDDVEFNRLNDFIFSPIEHLCISEKAKNIIELCSLPEHRFFNVDVYMPKKRNKVDANYYALHYDFTYIQNDILGMIDYEKSNIRIKTKAGEYHLVRDRKDVENLPIHNKTISEMISKLSETAKLREKNQKQISTLSEEYWSFEQVDKIYFNRSFNFSMDLFQIPYFSWMIYISDKLKEELERNRITGITFSIPGNKQYLVHRPNPILEWV